MSGLRWTTLTLLFLFFLQAATPGAGQTRSHRGRKKSKPVPRRPQNELSLGEVTIYGKNTRVRLPRNKVVPSENPQKPPLLNWHEFRLIPPSELQAPELPSRPSSRRDQIVQLNLRGGTFQSGGGQAVIWKDTRRWQVGATTRWDNTFGTHVNRFRHLGTAHLWGAYQLSQNWKTIFQLEFLQHSFGFGNGFSVLANQARVPEWRKVQALQYRWELQKNNANGDFWRVSVKGRFFPLNNETDHPALSTTKPTFIQIKEKTQVLTFEGQFTRSARFSLHARLISNQSQFSYQPPNPGLGWPPHVPLNSQIFARIAPSISKRLTPQLFGQIGFQGFYFSASENTSTILKVKPAARLLYSPVGNWEIFASYFAGYRFRSLFDAYGENPFCEQNLNLNILEFRKTRAILGVNWKATRSLTLGSSLSENLVENYPAWSSFDWLHNAQAAPPAAGGLLTPGLFHTTYLPSVHYNAWHGNLQIGQPGRRFLSLTLVARFNKSSQIDTAAQDQWRVPNDIPELPDFEIGFRGALPFYSRWQIAYQGTYQSARLVEKLFSAGAVGAPYLSEFFLLNLQLNYRLPFGTVFVGTWNVLDQNIEEFDQIWADGRKFFAGINVTF